MSDSLQIQQAAAGRKGLAAHRKGVQKKRGKRRGDDPGGMHDIKRDTATNNESARQLDSEQEVERDNLPSTWKRSTALEAPPPRPGFVQRWVRFKLKGQDDTENYDARFEEGWRPRKPSSVPRDHQLTTTRNRSNGQTIVKRGHILMELPQHLADSRAKELGKNLTRQTKAVENDLFKDNRGMAGRVMPLTESTFKSRAALARKRPQAPADDE